MSEERKSGKRTRKIKTMALSVLLAIVVWFTVIYVNDPDITTTVSDLNVRLVGELDLRDKGLAITGRGEIPQLSVVVSGKRSDLMNFMDDIYIQVNVGDISSAGEYTLEGAISLPTTRITVEKERYGSIPLTVEPLASKEISVSVKQTGSHKNMLVKSEAADSKVTITGAESEIDTVNGAVAEVDLSEVRADGAVRAGYLLTDKDGAFIEKNETIESNRAFIEVYNTLYMPKTLPVEALLTQELEKSYMLRDGKTTITPSTVTVGTDADFTGDRLLAYIDSIDGSGSGEYNISAPDGVYIPEDSRKVKVRYEAVKKTYARLELEVEPINTAAGFTAQAENISVNVYGEEGTLTADKLKATVDVKDLGAGEYTLPVIIEGDGIAVQESYITTVTIR